jgi:uncharacterized protein (DUF1810 family)
MEIQITAVKFEIVNGKKTGKSFAFKLDPKKMAVYKTEATLRKKIDEYILKNKVFKKEDIKDLKYNMKEFITEWKKQIPIVEAEKLKELEASNNHTENRITPEKINRLANNEVFVFGSNAKGLHHGGAAKIATEKFGAIMGQGHGLQGKSYAINSMSGIPELEKEIKQFVQFAQSNPQMHFLVTPIGCGIAGYSPKEIAPLFTECKDLQNVSLPKSFWKIISGNKDTENKAYDLNRFLEAQKYSYEMALQEMRNGRKCGHWIWYIFPQRKGLGHSYNSKFYGLDGIEEARAYLAHPVLGQRLREITNAVLSHAGNKDINYIMGSDIDVLKLQSCMNLFNKVAPNDVFKDVLNAFY